MTDFFSGYRDQLDTLEQSSMDNPDLLFAISYIRSHLDLLSIEDDITDPISELIEAVSSTFDTDKMSDSDRAAIIGLIDGLN